MTLAEAKTVIERAFPGQGVQLVSEKGACIVRHPKEGDIGKAFSWRPALQEACKPLLQAADKRRVLQQEQRREDFALFIDFLREKLNDDFEQWKAARAAAQAGDPTGATPNPEQLVQIVPG